MFDADLWDTDGVSSANFFPVPALDVYLSPSDWLPALSRKATPGRRT